MRKKTQREGSNPLVRRPTAVNRTLLIYTPEYLVVLLYSSTCATAVKRYINTTAAALRTESDHTKKP